MPNRPIRVLIVDDHVAVRIGLTSMLNAQDGIEAVGAAANGTDALALVAQTEPDIILLDLRMPHMDGLVFAQEIRERYPSIRIIILTSYDSDEDIYNAVRVGVQGYLLKNASEQELLDAIATVSNGHTYFPSHIITRLSQRVQRSSLSGRELEVLKLLSDGLTNKQIANTLNISNHTVRSHVSNITSKLDVSDRTEAVTVALKYGLIQL